MIDQEQTVRQQQVVRFRRLFVWSVAGSALVTAMLHWAVKDLWVSLSFLGLMVVMATFLSGYYAMLRVER